MTHRPRFTGPRRRRTVALVMLAAVACPLAGAAQTVSAASSVAPATVQLAQASEHVTLDQAVGMIRERTGGRILRAETRERNGRVVHRIRVLLEDGERVRTYHVDARTGRIS